MSTQYLAIDICIKGLTESEDIWMRKIVPLTFVPMEGMRLKLCVTPDEADDDIEHDIVIENIHYSFKEGQWIEEQEDTELYYALRQGEPNRLQLTRDKVAYYEQLGFMRLNFPTAYALVGVA